MSLQINDPSCTLMDAFHVCPALLDFSRSQAFRNLLWTDNLCKLSSQYLEISFLNIDWVPCQFQKTLDCIRKTLMREKQFVSHQGWGPEWVDPDRMRWKPKNLVWPWFGIQEGKGHLAHLNGESQQKRWICISPASSWYISLHNPGAWWLRTVYLLIASTARRKWKEGTKNHL